MPQVSELSNLLIKGIIKPDESDLIAYKEKIGGLTYGGRPNLPAIYKYGTSLNTIKRVNGLQFLETVLSLMIVEFQNNFNLIRPISSDQAADLAVELINDYSLYKLEDFIAFFQLAKKGVYGKILDRLDPATILQMFVLYDNHRTERFAGREMNRQESKRSPYDLGDRNEQNGNFTDRSAPIGDFIDKVRALKNKKV